MPARRIELRFVGYESTVLPNERYRRDADSETRTHNRLLTKEVRYHLRHDSIDADLE